MAELADAPDLGSGVYDVQVQVLLSALQTAGCTFWRILPLYLSRLCLNNSHLLLVSLCL